MKEKTAEQAVVRAAKDYLQQYHIAKGQKRILERRHDELQRELAAPALGSTYRSMPTSKAKKTDGAVSVVYRIAEVEARIEEQRQEMAKAVLHVMDLVDLLPPHSMERQVVELRHIDCRGWDEIARVVHLSRSSVFLHYNTGLEIIARNKRAQGIIREYMTAEKVRRGGKSSPLVPQ